MKNKKGQNEITRNIVLRLEYDGSGYNGWQRLGSNQKTVQAVIEQCLTNIFGEEIQIIGSGRTDMGVHALSQIANFHTKSAIPLEEIKDKLNAELPWDIRVLDVLEADKDFHSRYQALSKTYEYRIEIGERQSVFTNKYMCFSSKKLDAEAMNEAALYLLGEHDFKAFSTDRKDGKSTVRTIYEIKVYENINQTFYRPIHEIRIQITGTGFLYNMVRIIVGTLIEIGEGKRKKEEMKDILLSKNREFAGMTAYPQGLYLTKVRYQIP